jgi:predicted porin
MKKTLLGTTALVAVGLLAGPALASDPLKVTVGGNVVTGFYLVDADNIAGVSQQDTKVAVVARNIDIIAEGTLDNGLVAGVDAKLMLGSDFSNATTTANDNGFATFRQLFTYLEGGFGRLELGGTDGAAYKMHYTSPWFVPGNGVDSPNIYNGASTGALGFVRTSTFSLLATDANKVSYFTPRLAGFQLGLSYTPDASNTNVTANGLGVVPKNLGVHEVFEAALNYAGSFGGVDLGLDGFYTSGSSSIPDTDPVEYGFGANLGLAGFTLGGAWYQSEDISGAALSPIGSGNGAQVWTAGLSYATGPWTVGVAYLNAEDDSDTGVTVGNENESWQVGGGYNLGSGVDLGLDLQFSTIDNGTVSYDSQSAGLVLAVSF